MVHMDFFHCTGQKVERILANLTRYISTYRYNSRYILIYHEILRYIVMWYIKIYQIQDISQYYHEKNHKIEDIFSKISIYHTKWYILIYRYDMKHTQHRYIKIYHITTYFFKTFAYWYFLICHDISLYLKISKMTLGSQSLWKQMLNHHLNFKD